MAAAVSNEQPATPYPASVQRARPRAAHVTRPGSVVFPGQGMTGNGPSATVDRKHNAHSRQLISSAWSAPIWSVLMQNLDIVDWCLLAGSVVYFSLLLLRRI